MESVTISDNVETIGNEVFKGCSNSNFKTIIIPSSVKSLGSNVFDGCTNLENVYVSSSNTLGITEGTNQTISGKTGLTVYYTENNIVITDINDNVIQIQTDTITNLTSSV